MVDHGRYNANRWPVFWSAPPLVPPAFRSPAFRSPPPRGARRACSPGDRIEGVDENVQTYLNHGTSIVWIINPYARTLQVFRRGQPPVTLNDTQTYEDEELLPGLSFVVAELFVPVG